jgi:hypothetical protein
MSNQLDLEPAEILTLKTGLVRKCNSPTCEEIVATGDSFEPDELLEWVRAQAGDENMVGFDSPEAAAKAIQDVVDDTPWECGCALGS